MALNRRIDRLESESGGHGCPGCGDGGTGPIEVHFSHRDCPVCLGPCRVEIPEYCPSCGQSLHFTIEFDKPGVSTRIHLSAKNRFWANGDSAFYFTRWHHSKERLTPQRRLSEPPASSNLCRLPSPAEGLMWQTRTGKNRRSGGGGTGANGKLGSAVTCGLNGDPRASRWDGLTATTYT